MSLQRSGGDRGADVQPGAAPPRLKFKRAADGKLEVDGPERETGTAIEPAERPPTPDDPRIGPGRENPLHGWA
jgi:hypothetical protein